MKRPVFVLVLALSAPAPAAALDTDELLSLVAMPLAVAAVADLIEVPTDTLVSVVTALNQADVSPPQFIEVVRYVPIVLVDEQTAPQFVTFVTTQMQQGVVGDALAVAIANRLRTAGVQEINVTAPRVVVQREAIIPPVVVTRVAEVKRHPHGGPPGQLKKVLGVKTGAEVVHRTVRVDDDDDDDTRGRGRGVRGGDRDPRQVPAVVVEADRDKGKGRGKGQSGNPGKSGNSGKGKGKGKGR